MKNGFYFDLNRNAVLRGARRCMALLLALLLLVPANLATVLAEGTAGAQETRTLRYVGNLAPHKHTKDCRNKDGKLVCGIVEGEYYHEHNQYCRDEAGNLVCGLQEKRPHHHTDSCYKEEKTLVCGLEETAGHQHGEGCYTEKKELTCGLEETAGHQHGADCYTRTLTCGLEETAGHQHGEGCYERRLTCTEEHEHTADCPHEDVLVCGKAEGEGAHAHTDACYTDALTCGKAEGEGAHAHGDACYTVTRELTCGKAEGEGAHAHTDDCWKTSKVLTCTEGEPVVIDGVTFRIQTLTSSASDWQEEVVEAAPAEEETAEEEADAEENIEQEPAAEEAAAEESTVEETATEDPAAEETTAEETVEEETVEETMEEATEAEEAADEGEEMPSEPAGTEDRTFEYAIPGAQEVALSEVFAALGVVADGEWADFAAGIEAVEVSNPEALWLEETEGDWTLRAMREPEAGDALTAALADGSKITVEITAYGDTEASAKNDAVVISTVDDMYLPEEAAAEAVMPAAEEAPAQMLDVPDPGEDAESVCRVFDIDLANVDAAEYEGFDVAVNLDEDVVGADFKLYQVQGDVATDLTDTLELNSQVGADGLESVSGFTFRTDDFAQFVLCYSLETYYKTVEGETFKITVNFDEAAQIPFGAELKVREIEPGETDFQRYLDDSAAQLGVQSADVTFARFFDIEIVKDGEKVEPKAPVQVTIAYQDALELGEEDQLNVVHFADAGTEVISDVSVTDDGTQITYEQGSFSVTGTVVTNPSASSGGTHYALIVEYNGKYYSVRNDGTLSEVEYSEETNKATVKMDYPVLWTYASKSVGGNVTGQGNQTVNVLQLESSAAHIGAYAQPDDWYFYYIDPTSDDAITEEPTRDTSEQAAAQHPNYQWQCSVDYTDHKLRSHRNSSLYIGVDGDNFRIKGNASQAEAATVYFAEVDSVPASANLNHTVNHIDISVRGKASLTVPLALGDYTYVDETGATRPLTIDKFTDLELVSDVPITIDDMKTAEITAYSSANGILDNAFYITGYSQNNQAGTESNQVRIEGSFKVADLTPFNESNLDRSKDPAIDKDSWSMTPDDECQIKDADLTKRKDNRIYYTLTVNKDLEFKWIYKDANGHYGQLMDSSGKLLSSTISVNLSKSFDYWDEANECPPVYPKSGVGNSDDVAKWQKGHILWDTHAKSGSGMDFVLDIKNKSDPNVLAIEITKHILDNEGNIIHPQLPVSNQFVVYQNTSATQDDFNSVATLGGETPDYGSYHGIHTKSIIVGESGEGMVNDFDVKEGMAYIMEDESSVPDTITDTDGRTWVYSTTRNETEYVWRAVDKPADVHTAEGFRSIPEIIGNYGTYQEDGQDKPLFNGFLEFDVYNVYMPSASKKEVIPYEGTGTLGPVKVGQEITYEISYTNYKDTAATITIEDPLDPNVEFVSASDKGAEKDGVVTWTLSQVPAGESGTVTLKVRVLEGALKSNGGEGKVVNGGEGAVVSIDNEYAFTLEPVENPVIGKRETAPYEGTGELGGVKVGDQITYEIEYKNYKAEAADIVIKDTLDENVEFVSASDDGKEAGGVVTWTLSQVPAGESGTVTLTVKVLEGALESNGGLGKVINGGAGTTVKVGNDDEISLNEVENPVPEVPQKKETAPYEGTGVLGGVKVGDEITYTISYKNYKSTVADIVIKDTLDANVEYISSSDNGSHTGGVVTWTLEGVAAGAEGTVSLTVKVLEGALDSKGGEGKVVNGGDNATVKVGNDNEYTLNEVENPVPEQPQKKEIAPYEGTGVLGGVKVGDEITYEISYRNYKAEAVDIVIKDKLDANVEFVSASNGGAKADGVVTWTLTGVEAGKEGTVTLKVRVLEGALESKGGPAKVVNGGDGATVKVGNDKEYTLNTVENPVPEPPEKKETAPYEGTEALGAVKVGDAITYTITYKNYKADAADVVIRDTLDSHVKFVSASNGGVYEDGTVEWTIADVPSGEKGSVTLTVQVLDTALASVNNGPGKVVNGGDTATVKVGNDQEFELNEVENPVPEPPHKQETSPYEGNGVLGAVQVDDTITYKISYKNYMNTAADVVIKDELDAHVEFVSADNGGTNNNGTVEWTIASVPANTEGTVTLTVKVLGSAKVPDGPGMVVNGGDTATVKVGNDNEYSLEKVVNPVLPSKQEVSPYEGLDDLGAVKVGDKITYEIHYVNYTDETTDIVIVDTLDPNVEFVEAGNRSSQRTTNMFPPDETAGGQVKWEIKDVPVSETGTVFLTVRVLDTALKSHNPAGLGKVVNGGDGTTITVGTESAIKLNTVENPVPEPPHKKETAPYKGNGELGAVQVGSEITYEISYRNYKTEAADIVIADTLDEHVEFVSASDSGWNDNGVVRWTLKDVPPTDKDADDLTVTLKVKVLEGALEKNGGPGEVVNGGQNATVKVGNDNEFTLEEVSNPVPESPEKKETKPEQYANPGKGVLGPVKVGDEITYTIRYKNYKTEAATVVIKDKLDANVKFVDASNEGSHDKSATGGVVTWNLGTINAGVSGTVTLTVKVLPSAQVPDGPGKVVNGGKDATVQVGDDMEFKLDTVENPVPPVKRETAPYNQAEGKEPGAVKVGDEITYEICYTNYLNEAAPIVIEDKLDANVEFVKASDGGVNDGGVVKWTIADVPAGDKGSVTLKVKVLEGALESNNGEGKVVNGGNGTTVKVGNHHTYTLEPVENPVPEEPVKQETAPYNQAEGKEPGAVKVGDEITYTISYKNYKSTAADIVIKDTLDANVEYISSSDNGSHTGGVVTWTLKDVEAGKDGTVTLTVKVLDTALESKRGPGKVVNGGEGATVKVGNDQEYTLNEVENPVPETPTKKETAPYDQTKDQELGAVKVGDEITYTISYTNYKKTEATVTIKDTLDEHVQFVSASNGGTEAGGVVTWTLEGVAAGAEDTVTLKVRVLEGALKSKGGEGKVVNGGENATVKVGEDHEYTLNQVENPVPEPPEKKEITPYEGTGVLGGVKVGEKITYEISYRNYKTAAADIVIVDKLDGHVAFSEASNDGKHENGVVTWTLKGVPAGKEGTVTLTVVVLEGALQSMGGKGKVVNGGDTATVKVGNENAYTLNEVENPVPEPPEKKEITPFEGTGLLGAVKAGQEITYEISYKNYKNVAATVAIKDTLDEHVEFVEASDEGKHDGAKTGGVVTWTLENVAAGKAGKVTLTVKVLENAEVSNGGPGKVVNGGDTATVQVGEDHEYTLNTVVNPLLPQKQETEPYEGNGVLGGVKVGEEITYEIFYANYLDEAAEIVIKDTLDKNVEFVSASDDGEEKDGGVVTWTLKDVEAGKTGKVTLTVKVLEGALESNGGPGKVVNGGDNATVKVGEDHEYTLNEVENPVPEQPNKQEVKPYKGNGVLGGVKVGEEITYEIFYANYLDEAAEIVIKDTLDKNVEFVDASDDGVEKDGVVTWTLKDVEAGKDGTVTLTVKVLEGALESNGGPAKVVNGGENATVKVGNDNAYTLNEVENPVPEAPNKQEVKPYKGNGVLGAVKVGDTITYEISYKNYKAEKADIVITDTLDRNVEFVSASDDGAEKNGVVTWTLKDVEAGKEGTVTLTVKVLESALESNGGPGKVVNGGENATVKVGEDHEYTLNEVENPVPEVPNKQEIKPYEGNGVLGGVKVGDTITYEISYKNYKAEKADIVITDTLDRNVEFVSASDDGEEKDGVVTWTLKGVEAGKTGKVTLTVKVLEGALESNGGPGKVVNGGDNATVKVGNDNAYTLNEVENPVPEQPNKQEVKPYKGNGVLGGVKVGEEITYEIRYKNYKAEKADIVITDTLDRNVQFVSASDGGKNANGVVTWTLKGVEAGKESAVTLTVKVLKGALKSNGGPAKVVNGGENATVKVGDDPAYTLNEVENPVPEAPNKREVKPYKGTGKLGAVNVGDTITYEISYKNYKAEKADIVIKDTLDKHVKFVSASDGGVKAKGVVTWTLKDVEAGKEGTVTLTVKVLEGARKSNKGPGKVVNGGDNATVQVSNDNAYTLNEVENPVSDPTTGDTTTTTTQTTTLTGHKIWDDEGDVHGLRPQSITLQLLADGTPVNATPEWSDTDTDDWTFTYKNLRATTGAGITIHYTVQEVPVEGYECEIDGMTITNHLIPREPENYVNLSGVKTWEDDDDAEGKRPEGITVRLYRDGQVIDVKRVTGADGWKYSFGRLPADDGFGKVFTYTLREDGVEGYYARYNGMNVTNTLLPETPEKEPIVRKGTPRPDFSKLTETMWDELLALLGYDTPLFGMLATGDETPVYPYVFGGVGALAVLAWLMLERRKRRAAKQ